MTEQEILKALEDIKDPAAIIIIKYLLNENKKLRERIAVLEKNSSNSNKPPSSDIVKPKHEQRQPGVRKIGGQTKHPGVKHKLLPPEQVDRYQTLSLDNCPCCSGKLIPNGKEKVFQQYEFVPKPVQLTQYSASCYKCNSCNKIVSDNLPNSLLGIRLQSYAAYLKSAFGLSYSEIQESFKEVFRIDISRSTICNVICRTNKLLKPCHEELGEYIKTVKSVNCDETSWKDSGSHWWSWLFTDRQIAYFKLSNSRSAAVIESVLGNNFTGAVTSDFYSAYRKLNFKNQQFCLAHLIRDIKFLATLAEPDTVSFANKILAYFRKLFQHWHNRGNIDFIEKINRLKVRLSNLLYRTKPEGKAKALKKRLLKHWKNLFRFVDNPALFSPTNNLAEQTIRFLTRVRALTQGTRGTWGSTWIERSTSVVATCRKQNRSIFEFYVNTLNAAACITPFPSLIPNT